MFMVPYILVIYIYIYISVYIHSIESPRDTHGFFMYLYFTKIALDVSGAICTHHREHKLQSTAVSTRDYYGVLEVTARPIDLL
jgi:hypothetical protein